MKKISINSKVIRSDDVFVEKVDDESSIIFNISSGIFVSIDTIGAFILNSINEEITVRDVISLIQNEFQCEYDVTDDIIEFLNNAVDNGVAIIL